jgi:hypothetical protein
LHKKGRAGAKILPIPRRRLQARLRAIKVGYRKELVREVLQEVRIRGNEVRLTYKLPMTVRTPPAEDGNLRKAEFFTLY